MRRGKECEEEEVRRTEGDTCWRGVHWGRRRWWGRTEEEEKGRAGRWAGWTIVAIGGVFLEATGVLYGWVGHATCMEGFFALKRAPREGREGEMAAPFAERLREGLVGGRKKGTRLGRL